MREIFIISNNRILIQKLRLALPNDRIYPCSTVSEARGELKILDIDTCPAENTEGCLTVGRGGTLPYPFPLSALDGLFSSSAEQSPLYPLADGSGVALHGRVIPLTEVEMKLFQALYRAEGTVSREELMTSVWGGDADGGVLNVYVHYLRTKLEGAGEKIITATRGQGYKIKDGYRRSKDVNAD